MSSSSSVSSTSVLLTSFSTGIHDRSSSLGLHDLGLSSPDIFFLMFSTSYLTCIAIGPRGQPCVRPENLSLWSLKGDIFICFLHDLFLYIAPWVFNDHGLLSYIGLASQLAGYIFHYFYLSLRACSLFFHMTLIYWLAIDGENYWNNCVWGLVYSNHPFSWFIMWSKWNYLSHILVALRSLDRPWLHSHISEDIPGEHSFLYWFKLTRPLVLFCSSFFHKLDFLYGLHSSIWSGVSEIPDMEADSMLVW